MQIQQIQISYSAEEDRIILCVSNDADGEICLFLTRRLVAKLCAILAKATEHQHQQTPMPHQYVVQKSNKDSASFIDKTKSVASKPPVLVSKINIKASESEQFKVVFSSINGEDINLNLNSHLLHNLFDVILTILSGIDWNLALETRSSGVKSKAEVTLH